MTIVQTFFIKTAFNYICKHTYLLKMTVKEEHFKMIFVIGITDSIR